MTEGYSGVEVGEEDELELSGIGREVMMR